MNTLLEGIEAGIALEASRVDFRLACTFASQAALWAIDWSQKMAGTSPSGGRRRSKGARDARAAAKHVAMSPAVYITGGKLRLGRDLSNVNF